MFVGRTEVGFGADGCAGRMYAPRAIGDLIGDSVGQIKQEFGLLGI